MKLNKILGIATLLGGIAIATHATILTTSCSKNEWTFLSYEEIMNYLSKHIQNISEGHSWSAIPSQKDYEFVKSNLNIQLVVNSYLYSSALNDFRKLELKFINKNEFLFTAYGITEKASSKISLINGLFKVTFQTGQKMIEFDFNEDFSDSHYMELINDDGFYTLNGSGAISITLSYYDWRNQVFEWKPA